MTNTPQVEHLWLDFSDSGEDGVVPADHDARIVGPIANAVAPRDVSSTEINLQKIALESLHGQKIAYAKTKAQLISAFVFATRIHLYTKFRASDFIL